MAVSKVFGKDTLGSLSTWSSAGTLLCAGLYSPTEDITVDTLLVYSGPTTSGDTVYAGLYEKSGTTFTLLDSGSFTSDGVAAWREMPISVAVSTGKTYAIALTSSIAMRISYASETGKNIYYKTATATLPATFEELSKNANYTFAGYVGVTLNPPTVTTQAVLDIAGTTATLNGNITDIGVGNATARGFYVAEGSVTPTAADTVFSSSGSFGTGAYTESATSLSPGTLYSAVSFATNADGTSTGSVVEFTTLDPPTVTTQAVSGFDYDSAFLNGTITDIGGANATTRGFYWKVGTTGDPTASDNVLSESGSFGAEAYDIEVTGLSPETSYRIAAFATNPDGTSIGSTVGFTTTEKPAVAGGGGVTGLSFGIGRL